MHKVGKDPKQNGRCNRKSEEKARVCNCIAIFCVISIWNRTWSRNAYKWISICDLVGLDATVSLADYIARIGDLLQKDLKWYKRFEILFSLILLT